MLLQLIPADRREGTGRGVFTFAAWWRLSHHVSIHRLITCYLLTLQWTHRWFPSSIFTDEQRGFKALGHPIKENLDKVTHTCTYRMKTSTSQSTGCQFLCEVYKRATWNFKVILILETTPGIVISVTCWTFDVSSLHPTTHPTPFSSFNVMSIWKEIFQQHPSKKKTPPWSHFWFSHGTYPNHRLSCRESTANLIGFELH